MDRTFFNIKNKRTLIEFGKYAIVGCVNFLNNYICYRLFMKFFHWPYTSSFILGYVISIIGSYFLNTYFTYGERFNWKKFLLFPLTYIPNFIVQYFGMLLLVDMWGMEEKMAPVITTIVATPITFFVMKYLIKR